MLIKYIDIELSIQQAFVIFSKTELKVCVSLGFSPDFSSRVQHFSKRKRKRAQIVTQDFRQYLEIYVFHSLLNSVQLTFFLTSVTILRKHVVN